MTARGYGWIGPFEVDEAWLAEYVAYGLDQLARFLGEER